MRDGETPTRIVAAGDGWNLLPPGSKPIFSWDQLKETVTWYRGR